MTSSATSSRGGGSDLELSSPFRSPEEVGTFNVRGMLGQERNPLALAALMVRDSHLDSGERLVDADDLSLSRGHVLGGP